MKYALFLLVIGIILFYIGEGVLTYSKNGYKRTKASKICATSGIVIFICSAIMIAIIKC